MKNTYFTYDLKENSYFVSFTSKIPFSALFMELELKYPLDHIIHPTHAVWSPHLLNLSLSLFFFSVTVQSSYNFCTFTRLQERQLLPCYSLVFLLFKINFFSAFFQMNLEFPGQVLKQSLIGFFLMKLHFNTLMWIFIVFL